MSSSTSGFGSKKLEVPPVNMQEIFQDTWDHFVVKNNPPGYSEELQACSYIEGCAVGRLMHEDWREEAEDCGAVEELNDDLWEEFLNHHPGVNLDFLSLLQSWHDDIFRPNYYKHIEDENLLVEYYRNIAKVFGLNDPTKSALDKT
jgi:hypothetical protein